MNASLSQSVSVKFEFNIHFTEHLFSLENQLFRQLFGGSNSRSRSVKVAFVIDDQVAALHAGLIPEIRAYVDTMDGVDCHGDPLIVTGGEACKNDKRSLKKVLKLINDARIDKHSYLVAIGGGAVLDMAGFAASVAHRGVKHIRIPTTVLSQNDSGVGVKNSFNLFGKKNFVGCFAPPDVVINDKAFLKTLSQRDWLAGTSEAVKVALLKSGPFYEWLAENGQNIRQRNEESMAYLIRECARHHVEHISQSGDPFEKKTSRPLDFGHWAAHKLEQLTDFDIRHGNAVAIGLALDCLYAAEIGLLSLEKAHHVVRCLQNLGLPIHHPLLLDATTGEINPALLAGLEEFREHLGGILTITLIDDFGSGVDVHEIDHRAMSRAAGQLTELNHRVVEGFE